MSQTFVVRRPADVTEQAALASLQQRYAGASKIDLEPEYKNGTQMWRATIHMAAEGLPFGGDDDEDIESLKPPKDEKKEEKAEPSDDEGTSDSSKEAQILSLLKQIADTLGVTQKKHEEGPKPEGPPAPPPGGDSIPPPVNPHNPLGRGTPSMNAMGPMSHVVDREAILSKRSPSVRLAARGHLPIRETVQSMNAKLKAEGYRVGKINHEKSDKGNPVTVVIATRY